jgi:hypothetical protein
MKTTGTRALAVVVLGACTGFLFGCRAREHAGPQQSPPLLAAAGPPARSTPAQIEQFTYTRRVTDVQALGDRIWVGTTGGLVELDRRTGRFVRLYTTLDGMPGLCCGRLYGVGDALWMAGPNGVARFDPKTGGFRALVDERVRQSEYQPERKALWAIGSKLVARVDLAQGKAATWPIPTWASAHMIGDQLWTRGSSEAAIRCFEPLQGRTRKFWPSHLCPGALEASLCPAGDAVWLTFGDEYTQPVAGVGRIDRATGEPRLYRAADGLPGEYPRGMCADGSDVWVACSADPRSAARRDRGYSACTLARFNAAARKWEGYPGFSGARRDEPTCMKRLGADLWVATRGYDEMRKMVVGWMMVPYQAEAPAVKHLALCRWQPASRTWEVHRFPAEHNYNTILDFWVTSTDFWLLIDRTDLENLRAPGSAGRPMRAGLASCPRRGGALQWHFEVKGGYYHGFGDFPSPLSGLYVLNDTVWLCRGDKAKRFDAGARIWRDLDWPCRLAASDVGAVAARGDEVWAGTGLGALLRFNRAKGQFGPNARVTLSGPEWLPMGALRTVRGPDGTVRMEPERPTSTARWGPPTGASVTGLAFGANGDLWTACAGGSSGMDGAGANVPVCMAPAGLLRHAATGWAVPTIAPWSFRHRGETGESRFQPPPDPKGPSVSRGLSGSTAGIRAVQAGCGEQGVGCVLPDGERLWVGTLCDGLYLLEKSPWQRMGPLPPKQLPPLGQEPECRPDDVVIALARLGRDLCVATYDHLYRLDIAGRKWQAIGPQGFAPRVEASPLPERYSGNLAWQIRGASLAVLEGDLWTPGLVSGKGAGLYRLRAGAKEVEPVPLGSAPLCVASGGGYLWVGTEKGILRYDPKTRQQRWLAERQGLAASPVSALTVQDGVIWAAGPGAITRITVAEFARRAKASPS